MDAYRAIPRVSNSDLTRLKNQLFGYRQPPPEKALAFGAALHQCLLEPASAGEPPEGVDARLLETLVGQVRQHACCRWYLRFGRKERVVLFDDPTTGVACKSKLDVVYKSHTILDFKTTSARDYASFVASCGPYDYDRQAAFYLDGSGSKRFIFVGVQKCKPFQLFFFEVTREAGFLEMGRKKYRALLRQWREVYGV